MLCTALPMSAQVSGEEQSGQTDPHYASVVVTTRDMEIGHLIGEDDLTTVKVWNGNIPENAVSDPAELVGRYAGMRLYGGEYVYLNQTAEEKLAKANPEVLVRPVAKVSTNFVVVTDFIRPNTGLEVEHYLQELVDLNPNRTIYFPKGEYVLGSSLDTSAAGSSSVSIVLDDGAVLKASDDWNAMGGLNALVCLGGALHANDVTSIGSYYSIRGGVLDCNNKTNGISVNSGRETVIRNICIKNAKTGIYVASGANNKSSDCDFEDITIIGSGKVGTTGLNIVGYDNTFSNIRIYNMHTGVTGSGAGNFFKSISVINTVVNRFYTGTKGLSIGGNNWFSDCYTENCQIGYTVGNDAHLWDSTAVWTNDSCSIATAITGGASSVIMGFRARFTDTEGASNVFMHAGKDTELFGVSYDPSQLSAQVSEEALTTPPVWAGE